jgi:hypothetical protein
MQRTPPTASRAVLVGNGPSVDVMPPDFWRGVEADPDCMLIGTNRALCLCALQGARFDALVLRDTYRNLWQKQEWGAKYHQELWKPHPCWKVGPSHARVTHCDEFVRMAPNWQFERALDRDCEAAVMKQSSVVLMAANWAWLQDAREIALVGVDYRPGPNGQAHAAMIAPWGDKSPGWEGQYDRPPPAAIERQFATAVTAVRSARGRMVNFSPGSRLSSVPRETWHGAAFIEAGDR